MLLPLLISLDDDVNPYEIVDSCDLLYFAA